MSIAKKLRKNDTQYNAIPLRAELVGKDDTLDALARMIKEYGTPENILFTGLNGVGKDWLAWYLGGAAYCVNYEDLEDLQEAALKGPCGQCDACKNFRSFEFMQFMDIKASRLYLGSPGDKLWTEVMPMLTSIVHIRDIHELSTAKQTMLRHELSENRRDLEPSKIIILTAESIDDLDTSLRHELEDYHFEIPFPTVGEAEEYLRKSLLESGLSGSSQELRKRAVKAVHCMPEKVTRLARRVKRTGASELTEGYVQSLEPKKTNQIATRVTTHEAC